MLTNPKQGSVENVYSIQTEISQFMGIIISWVYVKKACRWTNRKNVEDHCHYPDGYACAPFHDAERKSSAARCVWCAINIGVLSAVRCNDWLYNVPSCQIFLFKNTLILMALGIQRRGVSKKSRRSEIPNTHSHAFGTLQRSLSVSRHVRRGCIMAFVTCIMSI